MSNQNKFFKYIYLYDVNGEVLRAGLRLCPLWVRKINGHSTCILRNSSPLFTPPCSILAPRLVPVTPSLQEENKKCKGTHKCK